MINPYTEQLSRLSVRELPAGPPGQEPSELELQARWFSGEFGTTFRTEDHDQIRILQFGVWNRESGPDFTDAAIELPDGRNVRGEIEVDRNVRDWENHGHAVNPAYRKVILHVFLSSGPARFFTRTDEGKNIPQVRIDLACLTDAPFLVPEIAHQGRCMPHLSALSPKARDALLEIAGRHRMEIKAAHLRRLSEIHGFDEALFQSLATALGYKENKLPFQILSQRLPLRLLRAQGESPEALLFGAAGFLGTADLSAFPEETRRRVRELWEHWWALRNAFERACIPNDLWQRSGSRPSNHPHRRLAALAVMVRHWRTLRSAFQSADPQRVTDALSELSDPFWNHHYTLRSARTERPVALVGESRIAEILANVFYPLALPNHPTLWEQYARMPAALANRRAHTTALRLFGNDARAQKLWQQQALLQIEEDFCSRDASACTNCRFPEFVATQSTNPGAL